MSRSRARNTEAAPSLLPFLAVMLCTLGVLVVLLMAMASVQTDGARTRHEQATLAASPHHGIEQQLLRKKLDEVEREKARAAALRNEARSRFENATGRLSQIEQSLREHQLRLEQLRLAITERDALDKDHTSDPTEAKARLQTLQERIAEKQAEIAQRREDLAKQPPSYAILPYDGPNGTRRRPIYIECLADRVVIQPEGIELGPADFNLALGHGTPLSAALRAARAYYKNGSSPNSDEAYPLVLVRVDVVLNPPIQ